MPEDDFSRDLLPGQPSDRIRLEFTDREPPCLIEGLNSGIERGDPVVVLDPSAPDIGRVAHISVGVVEELVDSLKDDQSTTLEEHGRFLVWAPAGAHHDPEEKDRCAVCGESIAPDAAALVTPSIDHGEPIVHGDCIPEFVDALDRVWEHSDNFLADFD